MFKLIAQLSTSTRDLKYKSMGFPFLGNNDNIDETAEIMIRVLIDKCQKWSKNKPELMDVVVEDVHQFIALKKAMLQNIQKLVENNKLEI